MTVLVWVSTLLPGLQALKSQATENVLYIKWFSVKLPFELKEVIFVCFLRSECFVLFCSDRVDPDRCVSVSVPPAASCFPSSPPLQILVHWTKGWRVSYLPPPLSLCLTVNIHWGNLMMPISIEHWLGWSLLTALTRSVGGGGSTMRSFIPQCTWAMPSWRTCSTSTDSR